MYTDAPNNQVKQNAGCFLHNLEIWWSSNNLNKLKKDDYCNVQMYKKKKMKYKTLKKGKKDVPSLISILNRGVGWGF